MSITFTDTHCHLADPQLAAHLSTVLQQSKEAHVSQWLVPATSPQDWETVLSLPKKHHGITTAIGIHPWFSDHLTQDWPTLLSALLQQHPHTWVGEIGLDFHHNSRNDTQQLDIFNLQLTIAEQLKRPIVVHNVKATDAIYHAIQQNSFTQQGIAHAFSGSLEEAHRLIDCGLLIGIGSLLLNPNAKKARQAATKLPLEHIVLETDSPFMLKDQINQPANVATIANIVATLRNVSIETISQQTEANFQRLNHFN